jgi:hypothetical protein
MQYPLTPRLELGKLAGRAQMRFGKRARGIATARKDASEAPSQGREEPYRR